MSNDKCKKHGCVVCEECAREEADAEIAVLRAEVERLREVLRALYALVNAECPRLLDETRGGDANVDMLVEAALAQPLTAAERKANYRRLAELMREWRDDDEPEPEIEPVEIRETPAPTIDRERLAKALLLVLPSWYDDGEPTQLAAEMMADEILAAAVGKEEMRP